MNSPEVLRVGLVLDDSLDRPDGVQQHVLTLGAWLTEQGHEVHYLAGHTERTDIPNIHSLGRIMRVGFQGNKVGTPLPSRNRQQIREIVSELDVVDVQMPHSPFMAGVVMREAKRVRVPIIGKIHILPAGKKEEITNRAWAQAMRGSLNLVDEFISVSEPAQAFARDIYGVESVVIPNPVDIKRFAAGKRLPEYEGVTTIMFLGRLVERKGCQEFLQAINYIHQHHPKALVNTKVVVGGRGELLSLLEQYVQDNGLADVVTFVGFVDEEAKPDWLASADVFCAPSLFGESFGYSPVEAAMAGKGAILLGDNPGYRSTFNNDPRSLIVPTRIGAFAGKIVHLLDYPEDRKALGRWQREYAARYDIEEVGPQVVSCYQKPLAINYQEGKAA